MAPDSQHSYPRVVARSVNSMVRRVFPMPGSPSDRGVPLFGPLGHPLANHNGGAISVRIQLGMIEASATCLDLVTRMDGSAPTAPSMTDGGARAPTSGYD